MDKSIKWAVFVLLASLSSSIGTRMLFPSALAAQGARFDVNDISYLWPAPTSAADVADLISAADTTSDGLSSIWPESVFALVRKTAESVTVKRSDGGVSRISSPKTIADRSAWKVVAFRVDPSAPGCDSALTDRFGSTPQIRLILQPVTVSASGTITVHDFAAHLVFDFAERGLSIGPMGPVRATPDKVAFSEILSDLQTLKAASDTAGAATAGPLRIHPGLQKRVPGFSGKVKDFLKRRVGEARLTAVAYMGIESSEPWIFFAMRRTATGFELAPQRTLGGASAQMLILKGGTAVMPPPNVSNLTGDKGVSTAALFLADANKSLDKPVFPDLSRPVLGDVPDLIANPARAHFFNTDCVSCHTESTRRRELTVPTGDGMFRYRLPEGISTVAEAHLPPSRWNVRNFGWFERKGAVLETISMRTANETAEAAEYINREYFSPKTRAQK